MAARPAKTAPATRLTLTHLLRLVSFIVIVCPSARARRTKASRDLVSISTRELSPLPPPPSWVYGQRSAHVDIVREGSLGSRRRGGGGMCADVRRGARADDDGDGLRRRPLRASRRRQRVVLARVGRLPRELASRRRSGGRSRAPAPRRVRPHGP